MMGKAAVNKNLTFRTTYNRTSKGVKGGFEENPIYLKCNQDTYIHSADGEKCSGLDGDACAFKKPDGSIDTGVVQNGVCVLPTAIKAQTETSPKNVFTLVGSSLGFAGGVYYAFKNSTGFWKGWGIAIIGSIVLGGIGYAIDNAVNTDKKTK